MAASNYYRTILIALTFHLTFISAVLEQYINPTVSVTCGKTADCTIICNQTESCSKVKFYLEGNKINIYCSAEKSCERVNIRSSNVDTLNIVLSGSQSFTHSYFYSQPNDTNFNIQCIATNACMYTQWHYVNQGTVTHSCDGASSCRSAIINAMAPISLYCGNYNAACERLSVILSTNQTMNNQSLITLNGNSYASYDAWMTVTTIFDFRNIICMNGCVADKIFIIYGIHFDRYCLVSDIECISTYGTITNMNNLTVINTYIGRTNPILDFSASSFDNDVLIIIPFAYSGPLFKAPMMNNNSWLSILCLYCDFMSFELGSIQNAVMTSGGHFGLFEANIYGPQKHYIYNVYHWASSNVFYLEYTSKITLNSIGHKHDVYLGNQSDVTVNCRSTGNAIRSCMIGEVWSSLSQSAIRLGEYDGFLNIDCPTDNGCSDVLIHLLFEEWPCTYHNFSSNCSFMILSSTDDPTKDPTNSQPTKPLIIHPPTSADSRSGSVHSSFGSTISDSMEQTEQHIAVHKQWWFYVIIIMSIVIILVVAVCVYWRKRRLSVSNVDKMEIEMKGTEGTGAQGTGLNNNLNQPTNDMEEAEEASNSSKLYMNDTDHNVGGAAPINVIATEGKNEYEWITNILMAVDTDWIEYLQRFQKNKITDDLLRSGAVTKDNKLWDKVVPELGVQVKIFQFIYDDQEVHTTEMTLNGETTKGDADMVDV